MAEKPFDPEGDDYDYKTAKDAGIEPEIIDGVPKWSQRDPRSGMQLKGRGHSTYGKGIEVDRGLGMQEYKGSDGRYYTKVPSYEHGGLVKYGSDTCITCKNKFS